MFISINTYAAAILCFKIHDLEDEFYMFKDTEYKTAQNTFNSTHNSRQLQLCHVFH